VELVLESDAPGNMEVWIDDVNVLAATPISLSAPDTYAFRWENLGTFGFIIDDLYVADSVGDQNNARLGPSRVVTLFPSADGTLFGWTSSDAAAHFSDVGSIIERAPQPYLFATDSASDMFVFPQPSPCGVAPAGVGRILAVGVNAAARAIALPGSLALGCWPFPGSLNPVGVGSAAVLATPAAYFNYQAITEVSLRTGRWPWTAFDVGAAQWGPMLSAGTVRCAEFYLELLSTLRTSVTPDCTTPTTGPNSYSFSS